MLANLKNILSNAIPVVLVRAMLVCAILWLVLPTAVFATIVCVFVACLWSAACVMFGRWSKSTAAAGDPFANINEAKLAEMILGQPWKETEPTVHDTQKEEDTETAGLNGRRGSYL